MALKDYEWDPIYESRFGSGASLVEQFHRPLFKESIQYDRLVGYLNLGSLADSLRGIESAITNDTDGSIRIVASERLQPQDKSALSNFYTDGTLSETDAARLSLIAYLLAEDRLTIKIAIPKNGSQSGIFHPKLGIATDKEGDSITFEGSINETYNAWYRNYERFKLHRSWVEGESKYVTQDKTSFKKIWTNQHPDVSVYPIDEALEKDILEWHPEDEKELKRNIEQAQSRQSTSPITTEFETTTIVKTASYQPGAIHQAEDYSSISPWPHQRVVADTAVSIYPENLLFCDEVGLGKTIEAGLSISRLVHSGEVKSGLILTPYSLLKQWQEELKERFNISTYRFDRQGGVPYLVDSQGEAFQLPSYDSMNGKSWFETPIGKFISSQKDKSEPAIILMSWHTARLEQNQPLVCPSLIQSNNKDRENGITGSQDSEFTWDVAVIDEVHNARKGTNLYDLVTQVNNSSDCTYLLTATPMQLEVRELYDILRICDMPDGWNDEDAFVSFFKTQRRLIDYFEDSQLSSDDMVSDFLDSIASEWEVEEELVEELLLQWCQMIRSHIGSYEDIEEKVESQLQDSGLSLLHRREVGRILGITAGGGLNWQNQLLDLSTAQFEQLISTGRWATPVNSRIFRNTRSILRDTKRAGLLDATIPQRISETEEIELGQARGTYDRIEKHLRDIYDKAKKLEGRDARVLGFVMTTYRKRLTSSLFAIQESLHNRLETLESDIVETLDEDVESIITDTSSYVDPEDILEVDLDRVGAETTEGQELLRYELEQLVDFIHEVESLPQDPKLGYLVDDLRSLSGVARDRVLIFTQFRDTLDIIKQTLANSSPFNNLGTYSGRGGEVYIDGEWKQVSKEYVKREFRRDNGVIDYLICTDAASEGLNLQTCDALINYDLPWNPMTVEQRIGRIDRIGQENEQVLIRNYVYNDTVESDAYDALDERINIFEQVVGPLRPILDGVERRLSDAAMGESTDTGSDIAEAAETDQTEFKRRIPDALASDEDGLYEPTTVTEERIIEETRLLGWGDEVTHPDIVAIGNDERRFSPHVSPKVIQQLFTQSETLRTRGWRFTRITPSEHPSEEDEPEVTLYRLTNQAHTSFTPTADEGTVQAELGDDDSCIVSFDPRAIDAFPSVILLLPGESLYYQLLSELWEAPRKSEQRVTSRLQRVALTANEVIVKEKPISEIDEDQSILALDYGHVNDEPLCLPEGDCLDTVPEVQSRLREWKSNL